MGVTSCLKCKHYCPELGYCKKLKRPVKDPFKPPCNGVLGNLNPAAGNPKKQAVSKLASLNDIYSTYTYYRKAPTYNYLFAPTGIPKLDEILNGGFLRGKTYLIAGETGCGKTIFSLQFLLNGVYLYNEKGVYLAIDEPASHVIKGMQLFGWDVKELIEQRKLLFLDMRTHFSRIYLRDKDRRIDPRIVVESIIKNVQRINAKRLVIDPIAPLMYGGSEEDILYAREFLREMVFELEKLGDVTTIMTSEIPTGSKKLSRFGVEEFLATGIIVLSLEEYGGKIYRVMYIRKARWAPVKPVKYVFDIVPGKGIVIKEPLSKVLKESL